MKDVFMARERIRYLCLMTKILRVIEHNKTIILTLKKTTVMKNFFSQTWVVAGLVVIVLGVVCYMAFKSKKEGDKENQGTDKANNRIAEV